MQVHRGLEHLPQFHNSVISIGVYDGVHYGHTAIIKRVVEKSKELGGDSIIVTFDPHPRQIVYPADTDIRLLTTLDEKIRLLSSTGVDHLIIIPFTVEFSRINPYKYVEDILIDRLKVKHLIIGYDHRFGLNREGNIDLLRQYEKKGALVVEEISRQDVDELKVSSTKIRNHIMNGDIHIANKLLGYNYELTGLVNRGSQIAGGLGYPTANCKVVDGAKLIPAPGTYAATAECEGQVYEGMLYIGKSPTLAERKEALIEMNLFAQIDEPLYDKEITIRPEKRYRGDQKFDSVQELKYNIAADKREVEHHFTQKKSEQLVTTAILNYNGEGHLRAYLDSHKPDEDNRVVVFDNASTDASVTTAQEFAEVNVISLGTNEGFAGGYNNAMPHVGSKYVAIVNSDIRVTSDWLRPIIDMMESDPSIAAVQPKIKSVHRPEEYEYAGAAGGFLDQLGYPFCRGRILNTVEEDKGQYDDPIEVEWSSGATMVMRTDLFKQAQGFDADFFAHMEEIDLCWRIRKLGYKIMCEPKSVVYHVGGGTLDYDSPRKVFLNLRNNYWMILKQMSVLSLLVIIPLRIAIDFMYSLLFLLKGRPAHFGNALLGIIYGLTGISQTSKKRREIKHFINRYGTGPERKVRKKVGVLPIAYYLLGKKKYGELS